MAIVARDNASVTEWKLRVLTKIWGRRRMRTAERAVLTAVLAHCDSAGEWRGTLGELAELTGLALPTLKDALLALDQDDLLMWGEIWGTGIQVLTIPYDIPKVH